MFDTTKEEKTAMVAKLAGIAIAPCVLSAVSTLQAQVVTETRKLIPAEVDTAHEFGFAADIFGDTAIVSARFDSTNGTWAGAAYLCHVETGETLAKLLPNDGSPGDQFGYAVAIAERYIVIGSPFDADNGFSSGSAYVFDRKTGAEIAKLLPSDGSREDRFGVAVGVSGNIAVIGSFRDDDNGANSGSAYFFDITTGEQLAKILPEDGGAHEEFGISVSISGRTAIVGAGGGPDARTPNVGSAYLFDVPSGKQLLKLMPNDGAEKKGFGMRVDICNGTAIVGAYSDSSNGQDSGCAYLFDVASGSETHKITPNDGAAGSMFGTWVSISGSIAIVGAKCDAENGLEAGAAYLFDTGLGSQIAKLLPSDGSSIDNFGQAVSVSDDIALVSAFRDDDNGKNSGSMYVFNLPR